MPHGFKYKVAGHMTLATYGVARVCCSKDCAQVS